MRPTIPLLALSLLSAPSLFPATLFDAETALKAGDPRRALALLDGLLAEFPQASEDAGRCLLQKSEVLLALDRPDDAEALLRRIPGIAGMPSGIVREAALRRIRLLRPTRPRDAREAARAWLRDNPAGPDAAAVRLLLSGLLRDEGDLRGALAALESRPVAERASAHDAPLVEATGRLRLALKIREKSAEYRTPAPASRAAKGLAAAEALRKDSPRKAADAYARLAAAPDTPPHLRLEAALARVDCLDEADDPRGALAAAAFLATFDDPAPPARLAAARLAAAALTLDVGEDPAKARSLAEDALAVVAPGSPEAEEARWLLARAALRRKASPAEIREILADSPVVRDATRRPDDPRHPVNRLIAAGGSLSRWIEADLHQAPPAATSALLRAADECFAATRYAEAARRYARAEKFGAPGVEVRAYAALQRARATALSPSFAEAPDLYRRFVSDKTLARSAYAPGALLRAGTFCEGRLRDTARAREFFRLGYAARPDSEPGQACLVHLAESLADSGDRSGALRIHRDHLKKHPDGHHAAVVRTLIQELQSPKKP